MSGQQKRGFRLPWNAEQQRGSDEASAAATVDRETLDSPAGVGEELGDGGIRRAAREPAKTMDVAPATSDVPDPNAEAEMIETHSSDGAWPTTDRAAEAQQAAAPADVAGEPDAVASDAAPAPIAARADTGARIGKRENPLVAGLVKAMREAAVASRSETTTRLQAEAAARIEAIRAESTDEAAALRKRVDDDIAGIREWSKVEMARIRAETEHRIEERRADAINESQRHLDTVEELVQQVQSTVSTFEADMDSFFERLLAETDPARLAALAEQAPDAPDLTGELPNANGWTTRIDETAEGQPQDVASAGDSDGAVDQPDTHVKGVSLEATAAAEAEAAATEGLDLSSAEEWPAAVMAAAARDADEPTDAGGEDSATSRLLVTGLNSVAGISAFKGAIGGLSGIRSVSVSTGERGVFIYTVHHDQETNLAAALADLSAFAVEVTESAGDRLTVTAHEPAA